MQWKTLGEKLTQGNVWSMCMAGHGALSKHELHLSGREMGPVCPNDWLGKWAERLAASFLTLQLIKSVSFK